MRGSGVQAVSTTEAAAHSTGSPVLGIWARLRSIAAIAVGLLLTILVIREYQIESQTFYNVAVLTAVGFIVHAVLPLRFRLDFFVGLSLAAIVLALGMRDGLTGIAAGLVIIGVCHLPIRFGQRIGVLLATGAILALCRGGALPSPWSEVLWPILGSFFMFRLILYMYAIRKEATRPSFRDALAYFFMLPNVCFPLFPVVDFTTFRRYYYDTDEFAIYERGLRWIVRGLIHLLLYRLVYMHVVPAATAVADLGDLLRYLLGTFLLYLRVSGQFHLIVGVLHLFGFRLPETHRLYFLASSFTDFWRRINIYWKDFMLKTVYYPSYFRLRRFGTSAALVGATLLVFLATWLLHSYQWFWLRGGFPIVAQDMLFWSVLGGLVVVGALKEAKQVRKRKPRRTEGWDLRRAMATVGTFTVICVLWSLWSTESVGDWLAIWGSALHADAQDVAVLAGLLCGFLVIAGRAWDAPAMAASQAPPRPHRGLVLSAAALALVLLMGRQEVAQRVAPGFATAVAAMQSPTLNARDASLENRGYYENLDNVSRLSAEVWDAYAERPADWVSFRHSALYNRRADFLQEDMRPRMNIVFWGQPLSTNRWGMRDRDYLPTKPEGTYRIAVLGPSYVMGAGVGDRETFEWIVEDRLNREFTRDEIAAFEVLNFGVGASSLLQQLAMLENRALSFAPDLVIVAIPELSKLRSAVVSHLVSVLTSGVPIPYPELEAVLDEVGVRPEESRGVGMRLQRLASRVSEKFDVGSNGLRWGTERRLHLAADTIVAWALERIAERTTNAGAVPVALMLDIVTGRETRNDITAARAATAGFLVWDFFDVYDGYDPAALRLAEWDKHPNARGHRVIADRLLDQLRVFTGEGRGATAAERAGAGARAGGE